MGSVCYLFIHGSNVVMQEQLERSQGSSVALGYANSWSMLRVSKTSPKFVSNYGNGPHNFSCFWDMGSFRQ